MQFLASTGDKGDKEWGGTQVAGVSVCNTCVAKASETCRGLWQICWPLVSLWMKSARFVCRAGHHPPRSLLVWGCYWRPLLSSLFLAVSMCLSFASLGGVKPKLDFYEVSQKAREVGHSPCPSFSGEGNSF